MIRSMTGFGRCAESVNGYDISVEIKSVNHRYADYSIRVPRMYGFLEDAVKKHLQQYISRGKVDVFVTVRREMDATGEIILNEHLAKSYIQALKTLAALDGVKDDLSVSTVARMSDIFEVRHEEEDEALVTESVLAVVNRAAHALVFVRETEGEGLKADMLARCRAVRADVEKIESIAPGTAEEYRQSLEERIRELLGDVSVDESRLLTEVTVYADKIGIDEELVRLRCHLEEFDAIMARGGAVGRRLDFLLQELNRETNTIGSKANNTEISNLVINIKTELEKIREQLQNLE